MGMGDRRFVAETLARDAGLYLIDVDEPGLRFLRGGFLEVGPDVTDDELATVGCRRKLAKRGVRDDAAVRAEVEAHGFTYVQSTASAA